jgi:hypothetical protein
MFPSKITIISTACFKAPCLPISPATLVPFYAILNPRLRVLPFCRACMHFLILQQTHTRIFSVQRDICYYDFAVLRDAGYRGVIFDKDNCLVSMLLFVQAA